MCRKDEHPDLKKKKTGREGGGDKIFFKGPPTEPARWGNELNKDEL